MKHMTAARRRRARGAQTRHRQAYLEANRIVARISGRHIYAQIISPEGRVLACACTPQKVLRDSLSGKFANIAAAQSVGRKLAETASAMKLGRLAFDRGGRKYHGRIRALAEALREGGLQF